MFFVAFCFYYFLSNSFASYACYVSISNQSIDFWKQIHTSFVVCTALPMEAQQMHYTLNANWTFIFISFIHSFIQNILVEVEHHANEKR